MAQTTPTYAPLRDHLPCPGAALRLPEGRLFGLLLALMTVALFTISPMMLAMWGLHYEVPGGSVLEKIHPATTLALLALALAVIAGGQPLLWLNAVVARHKGLILFATAWAALVWHVVSNQHMPFTPLVDTFALPMVLLLLFDSANEKQKRTAARLIHFLLALNAVLALVEFRTGWRLTPFVAGDMVISDDWRATALLGHPLNNASVTGAYLVALAAGGGRDLPAPARIVLFALNLTAMNAFGGRVSFVITLGILGVFALYWLFRLLSGKRFAPGAAVFVSLALPVAVAAVAMLYDAGFFDKFFARFISDKGSAEARFIMLELFRALPERDILFGPQAAQLTSLMRMEGLIGLESFWVAFVLSYGALFSIVFFTGLLAFLSDMVLSARPAAVWLAIFFLLEATTSVSVSAKTTSFAMLLVIALTLLRRPAPPCIR